MKMVVGQKFNAFVHIAPFMNVSKKRIIMQSFIKSQFGYGPLIWISKVEDSHIMMNRHHSKNYSLKIALQQYIIET